jgi:hypothetical protein
MQTTTAAQIESNIDYNNGLEQQQQEGIIDETIEEVNNN